MSGKSIKKAHQRREKRRARVRAKVRGTASCPRLSVFRSGKHIYAQLVNDDAQKTLVGLSDKGIKSKKVMTKTKRAGEVGRLLAERAIKSGIKRVVFDRSSFAYHGRVKALADGAKGGGLKF